MLASDPRCVERTSTAGRRSAPTARRSYVFDLDWRLSPVADDGTPLVVHACSLGAVLEPGADDVARAAAPAARPAPRSPTTSTRGPAITGTGPEVVARVERMVAVGDLVKACDEDLAALYPDLDLGTSARRAARARPGRGRGDPGRRRRALARTARDRSRSASRPVEVADTIGAGDTFGAGLIDALWERGRLGAERAMPCRA